MVYAMKKQIVLVCFKYPPIYSGYGKQLKLITENILKNSDDIEITLLTGYKESVESSLEKLNIIPLLSEYDNNSKSVFPFAKKVFQWLKSNRKNYSVIHCVKAGPEAMACNLISKLYKKPLIVKVAQDELSDKELYSNKKIKFIFRLIRQKYLSTSNYFIAISEEIKSNLDKRIGKNTKIISIPNGVDIREFAPVELLKKTMLRKKLNIEKQETVLLYVGAINRRKGVYDLLNSFEHFQSISPFRLIMCGPVLEDRNFFEIINSLNKKKKFIVDYRGKVSNVNEYMNASDIFILPSYSEGLPNVLLEASASGLAVITTDIGGSRDIVLDGVTGYIVPTNSPLEIADRISSLNENKELMIKMGKEARRDVVKRFSVDNVTAKYINIYRELSNKIN